MSTPTSHSNARTGTVTTSIIGTSTHPSGAATYPMRTFIGMRC